jgi:hypothetical protein
VTAPDPDRNAWAGHPEAHPCLKELSPVWTRDPLDGGPIGTVLDRLAARRGHEAVRSALLLWLSEPVLSGDPDGRQD